MRSVVLIHGLLKGMGHKVPCEMLAMKESTAGTHEVVFSRCSVIDAPMDLPDGSYEVSFNEYNVPARKEGGLWIPAEDSVAVPIGHNPEEEQQHSFAVEETHEILSILKRPRGRVA